MATATFGEGRMIPVLILDTSTRADFEKLISFQVSANILGDAESVWTFKKRRRDTTRPQLVLNFSKPSQLLLIIEFDLPRQGVLVDQILLSHGVSLQPGRPGDRLKNTIKNPRIYIEIIRNEIFREQFEKVYKKAILRYFRQNGMSRVAARRAVNTYLRKTREFLQQRLPFRHPSDDIVPESSDGSSETHS